MDSTTREATTRLGNDLLHQLTTANRYRYKLRCLIETRSSGVLYEARYRIFVVGGEAENYTLTVDDYSGNRNIGDAMRFHDGMAFTTYDRDNGRLSTGNCAQQDGGGFWHNACYKAGITVMNGGEGGAGFTWYSSLGFNEKLNSASMWLTC